MDLIKDEQQSGNYLKKVFMKKILIISMIFLAISCSSKKDSEKNILELSAEIERLSNVIKSNLKGYSTLQDFENEQTAWEKFVDLRLNNLLYPDKINDVHIPWGSIESYGIGEEMKYLYQERINQLERYINRAGKITSGTDGKGDFEEYVDELEHYQYIQQ